MCACVWAEYVGVGGVCGCVVCMSMGEICGCGWSMWVRGVCEYGWNMWVWAEYACVWYV